MLTAERLNFTVPQKLAEAAQRKSKETGVILSFVIQRALAKWIATGEIADVDPNVWESMMGAYKRGKPPKAKRVSKPKK